MIKSIKVSSKGQIVIPEGMRKKLKIKEGSEVIAYERGNKIIIESEEEFEKTMETLKEKEESRAWLTLSMDAMQDWFTPEEDEAWKHL